MATQSASGNRDSATTLESGLRKFDELTTEYQSCTSKMQTKLIELQALGGSKGCLNCVKEIDRYDTQNLKGRWVATAIYPDISVISETLVKVTALSNEVENFSDQYGKLKGKGKTLETLADKLEAYQKEITKALSDDRIKSAAVSSMVAKFASNKYDAKNGDYIPKEKVITAPDSWEGDLKFEKQDNGTYLVIKVGKDGSEVPMGYTTRGGKNKYYKEAKKKVLNDLKDKTKSSKEKTTSSKEKTTSSKEENIASNSNSKSTYASSDDISHNLSQNFTNRFKSAGLTGTQKETVSKQFAADLEKYDISKKNLKGCSIKYRIETESGTGKKIVYVKASKRSSSSIDNSEEIKLKKKYYLDNIG